MIYNNIKKEIIDCTRCPLYQELDYSCVPQWGVGSKLATTLIINLRSTQESHLIEKPVDTKCMLLLQKLIDESNMAGKDVFLTNLLKCKALIKPTKKCNDIVSFCKDTWLDKELACLPNVKNIVVFGKHAASILLKNNNVEISDIIASVGTYNTYPVYITYSLEELFRKGVMYYNHALDTLKHIREINVKV